MVADLGLSSRPKDGLKCGNGAEIPRSILLRSAAFEYHHRLLDEYVLEFDAEYDHRKTKDEYTMSRRRREAGEQDVEEESSR